MTSLKDKEIDRIVDECVSDKSEANLLKNKLHTPEHTKNNGQNPTSGKASSSDGDDLWDNLPI